MARIRWVEDDEATGEIATLFDRMRAGGGMVPDIMRCFSPRPDFLKAIRDACMLHFTDGALSRAQHEMIASHVSAINRCHY